jgi:hypothetical protein
MSDSWANFYRNRHVDLLGLATDLEFPCSRPGMVLADTRGRGGSKIANSTIEKVLKVRSTSAE